MVKPFEDASFSLKADELSDIVETPFGYHIIKVDDSRPEGQKPLKEVKDQIKAKLTEDFKTAVIKDFLQKAMIDARVEAELREQESGKDDRGQLGERASSLG